MTVPTRGETYARLMEHVRLAQEDAAMMAHLIHDDDRTAAERWINVSELFKKMQHSLTQLAMGHLN